MSSPQSIEAEVPEVHADAPGAGVDWDRFLGDPDLDVIELIAANDLSGAFTCLERRYGVPVRAFILKELGDAALADDVWQTVFIQVNRDLPRFAARSLRLPLRAWLFAIARHRVLDAIKKRKREIERFLPTSMKAIPDPGPPPGDRLEESRLHHALCESVRTIDERARTALILRYQQGFTFEELAEILGERPNTLQVRVSRALPKLRNRMEAYREAVSA